MKAFAALAFLFAISCPRLVAQAKPCPTLEQHVADRKFSPGQVWSYFARPGELNSTATILAIDSSAKIGVIIHVRVDRLRMHNPRGELVPSIEHMPFTRDAMLISVDRLLQANAPLPTMEGYEYWHVHCGGVYSISVADAVSVAQKTFDTP